MLLKNMDAKDVANILDTDMSVVNEGLKIKLSCK